MQAKLRALLLFAGAVAAFTSCGGPTDIGASASNIDNRDTVYAMNGTPQNAPAGLAIRSATPATLGPNFAFDLAFDLNAANEVVIYTVRAVANQLLPVHRVGLQTTTQTFDQVLRAPTTGYVYDSLLAVPIGRTVLVDLLDGSCAQSLTGANIRAKLVVDSLNTATRAVYVHILANPNCGFKSLTQGLPKD